MPKTFQSASKVGNQLQPGWSQGVHVRFLFAKQKDRPSPFPCQPQLRNVSHFGRVSGVRGGKEAGSEFSTTMGRSKNKGHFQTRDFRQVGGAEGMHDVPSAG